MNDAVRGYPRYRDRRYGLDSNMSYPSQLAQLSPPLDLHSKRTHHDTQTSSATGSHQSCCSSLPLRSTPLPTIWSWPELCWSCDMFASAVGITNIFRYYVPSSAPMHPGRVVTTFVAALRSSASVDHSQQLNRQIVGCFLRDGIDRLCRPSHRL